MNALNVRKKKTNLKSSLSTKKQIFVTFNVKKGYLIQ